MCAWMMISQEPEEPCAPHSVSYEPTSTGNYLEKEVRKVRTFGSTTDSLATSHHDSLKEVVKRHAAEWEAKAHLVNDDGKRVCLGKRSFGNGKNIDLHGTGLYYCHRRLGEDEIQGSDGQCGPRRGPQCVSCRRFQESPKCPHGQCSNKGNALKKQCIPNDSKCANPICDASITSATTIWRCAACEYDLCSKCGAHEEDLARRLAQLEVKMETERGLRDRAEVKMETERGLRDRAEASLEQATKENLKLHAALRQANSILVQPEASPNSAADGEQASPKSAAADEQEEVVLSGPETFLLGSIFATICILWANKLWDPRSSAGSLLVLLLVLLVLLGIFICWRERLPGVASRPEKRTCVLGLAFAMTFSFWAYKAWLNPSSGDDFLSLVALVLLVVLMFCRGSTLPGEMQTTGGTVCPGASPPQSVAPGGSGALHADTPIALQVLPTGVPNARRDGALAVHHPPRQQVKQGDEVQRVTTTEREFETEMAIFRLPDGGQSRHMKSEGEVSEGEDDCAEAQRHRMGFDDERRSRSRGEVDSADTSDFEFHGAPWDWEDALRGFEPRKTAGQYILEDCCKGFDMVMRPEDSPNLPLVVSEAKSRSKQILARTAAPDGETDYAFALVAYTIDIRRSGSAEKGNLYQALNKVLQSRRPEAIEHCTGYLHFFARAVRAMPLLPAKELYRGIPRSKLHIFDTSYGIGRKIAWSAVTSVSEEREVAKKFAGYGGIVVYVTCQTARSLDQFSEFPKEREAILLPNWSGVVTRGLTFDAEEKRWHISLVETSEGTFTF